MAQSASRRGVRYYFRIEFSTLQGKITSGFCFLGVFAVVLMASAYWVLNPALQKSQYVATVLQPSQYQLLQLSAGSERLVALAWERVKTDEPLSLSEVKEADQLLQGSLDSLQALAAHWQLEESRMDLKVVALKTGALLGKIHQLARTPNPLEQLAILEREVASIRAIQTSQITKLQQQHLAEVQAAQTLIDAREANLIWILLGSMAFAAVIGATLGTIIVTSVLREIRRLKHKILELSEGKLIAPIPPSRNELNSINKAVNELSENLRTIQEFAQEVGQGNFDTNIQAFDGRNELGLALAGMRDSLKTVALEEKQRSWIASGLAHFATMLRSSSTDLTQYYQHLISELVRYLGVNQAALYVAEEDELGRPMLHLKACYAWGRLKWEQKTLAPGQGMAGQVFLEKTPLFLNTIPQNYLQISSGLGDATPNHLALVPLQVNDTCNGVLELASFKPLARHELEFLLKLSENISAALQHVHSAQTTDRLLQEAREMASAMQMQEEMLRQNSEELIATQEKLSRDLKEASQLLEVYTHALGRGHHPQFLLSKEGQVLMANAEARALLEVAITAQQHISSLLKLPELVELLQREGSQLAGSKPYTHPEKGMYALHLQPFAVHGRGYAILQLVHQTSALPA
ncbi:GAF domain-containing protein [Cesiribacter andamanensis]|uniref:Putative periplasmic ligand-binding sensor domain protein n=1 Tax=Cesiribacter andamanensis AMV16 TaxID=1279009 RepID=M7N9P1_9BACT|nr:GAF domain-containing protein [Cesiribacter andamanensis]EMR03921.1 putative periplasmic ligand-binding sensor domain protein [Cesiribacter andamanensis AMV16]